jgi:RimJ/RimL family protein N-acetyltransferase
VRINDEPLLKDLFYSLSDQSMYRRFMSQRRDMPHERLQEYVIIDYTKEMIILATIEADDREIIRGMGQFIIDDNRRTAELAIVVRDEYQNRGIGTEILNYLSYLARREGLHGFTGNVLMENKVMLHLIEKMEFDIQSKISDGVHEITMIFKGEPKT